MHSETKSTILIVDDAPENIQVLSEILYKKNLNIAIALSGREALSVIARNPPDLILLDIIMPHMNGFEVCEHLKQDPTTREIPVIFLTGSTQAEDVVKGLQLGAVDYITKPFNSAELISRVHTHLDLQNSQKLIADQNQRLMEQNRELHNLYEQQYRSLAEKIADGVGILQKDRIVFANSALSAMLGYTTEQLLAIDPIELIRQDYRDEAARKFMPANPDSNSPLWQVPYVTADKRDIWVEIRHSAIEWKGTSGVLFIARDITHNKLREIEIEREKARLESVATTLTATMKDRYRFGDLIGKSLAMQVVYELILKAAASGANVVIQGESGTGKELVAWTIHRLSQRREKVFLPVNCGAIPENLFEREFFGHRKGAFTGAHKDRPGFFDYASKGTLFLDEIGELPLAMQVKFLRALSGDGYTPIGDHIVKHADVRIIAATNSDLSEMVRQGRMREDFYYRITVVPITLPPLRERREDIPLLIDHFWQQLGESTSPSELPGDVLRALYEYDWPGNIRELQNALQRYMTTKCLDFIAPHQATPEHTRTIGEENFYMSAESQDFHDAVNAFEKQLLLQTLEHHHWHRTKTAAALGLSRRSLFRQMQKHGLL